MKKVTKMKIRSKQSKSIAIIVQLTLLILCFQILLESPSIIPKSISASRLINPDWGDPWEDWQVQYMGARGWFSDTCDCDNGPGFIPYPKGGIRWL